MPRKINNVDDGDSLYTLFGAKKPQRFQIFKVCHFFSFIMAFILFSLGNGPVIAESHVVKIFWPWVSISLARSNKCDNSPYPWSIHRIISSIHAPLSFPWRNTFHKVFRKINLRLKIFSIEENSTGKWNLFFANLPYHIV